MECIQIIFFFNQYPYLSKHLKSVTNVFFLEEKWAGGEQQNLLSASFEYDTLKLSRNPDKTYFSSVLQQN